jgi:hypothetical protein
MAVRVALIVPRLGRESVAQTRNLGEVSLGQRADTKKPLEGFLSGRPPPPVIDEMARPVAGVASPASHRGGFSDLVVLWGRTELARRRVQVKTW